MQAQVPEWTDGHIDCGNYFVRLLTIEDASDRWAQWTADPEAASMLNAPLQAMTKADLVQYIRRFDQKSHLLSGIFEKRSGKHIGIIRTDIDYASSQCLTNLLIGEPEYRNHGVTSELTVPCRDWGFETLGLRMMKATALARNKVVIHYMLSTGWKLDKTVKQHVKSRADGTMLDLCFFSLSREDWRAWKRANLPRGTRA
jgi:RimJ/RimL family protein N-acetyltransferase